MNWKTKAAIQRAFARLPFGSEAAYYQLQRRAGNLRHPESPLPMLRHAAEIFDELQQRGTAIAGARVLEVGTGHRLNMPLAFYLAGAASIVSVDLFPILKPDLVMESLRDVLAHSSEIAHTFAAYGEEAVSKRLARLADVKDCNDFCARIALAYRAPCDATRTGLPAQSIDIHFSYTVFEHIPQPVLVKILIEGSRLISDHGLLCHHIDLSDHYSHSDTTIGKINFLQFSSDGWSRIDNPRFGYQNRLRVTDYRAIYRDAEQDLQAWITIVDPQALDAIRNGFPLAPEYQFLDPEILATVSVRAISRPLLSFKTVRD